jgi:hypothetical protein
MEDIAALEAVEAELQAQWGGLAAAQAHAKGQWMRVGDTVVSLKGRWGEVRSESRLGTDPSVEVRWLNESGPPAKMQVEIRGVTFLVDLSLVSRRGGWALSSGGELVAVADPSAGERERLSVSIGLTKK